MPRRITGDFAERSRPDAAILKLSFYDNLLLNYDHFGFPRFRGACPPSQGTPMTSDRLAGYSRLMATLTLLLIAGMLLLDAACWIFPDLASEHGLGFALTATGVAGDLGVVARDMPLWQALGGILLSSLPLLVLASGLQALRRLFQHYGRGEYFCEDAAALLGKVGLCLACWVLANFLLEPLLTVWVTFLQPQGQRIVSLSFGSAELVSLFAAASVMVIARIQRKAALLAEENRQFV